MKRQIAILIGTLVLLTSVADLQAFYNPGTGRWLNRDPLGEAGFEAVRRVGVDVKGDCPNLYASVRNEPIGRYDYLGLKVQVCCRNLDVNPVANAAAWLAQAQHCWVKTDTKAAGMGPAAGGTLPGSPCCGTLTAINDHSEDKATRCFDIPYADETCVNDALEIGKPLGEWKFRYNCNTFATDVVKSCGGRNVCLRWVTVTGPEFGEFTLCREWAVPTNLLLPFDR
jgi:hypothetical protein